VYWISVWIPEVFSEVDEGISLRNSLPQDPERVALHNRNEGTIFDYAEGLIEPNNEFIRGDGDHIKVHQSQSTAAQFA
tara:strand:- start:1143 stop:1376 length:234 start_codon:yes stop_codon:yes gene_type:complete